MTTIVDYTLNSGDKLMFEIEYQWDNGYRGSRFEPPRGSGMEDYEIRLVVKDKALDITELLSDEAMERIVEKAETELREAV